MISSRWTRSARAGGLPLAGKTVVVTGTLVNYDRVTIETAIKDVRDSLTSEDAGEIRSKSDALQAAFQKVSEQIYSQAAEEQAATSQDGASQNGAGDEEVVDAEVVDDEKTS